MCSPMFELPVHCLIAVNAEGQGPADPGEAVSMRCWCSPTEAADRCPFVGVPELVARHGPCRIEARTRTCQTHQSTARWNDLCDWMQQQLDESQGLPPVHARGRLRVDLPSLALLVSGLVSGAFAVLLVVRSGANPLVLVPATVSVLLSAPFVLKREAPRDLS